ncbi:hypothetical protein NUV89_00835 [Pseudomonas sp. 18.1.10]|uniref:hypothetical protein n=1 Tax=Pseudomonas sp. 18.1.10 TaxID=2969302 RepID=UPI0021504E7A|nr:hypothetical protein [Pseudomonas sp. 18.1.10]MCR4536939.1 hypothetical protein [Pseudomonas sp. 18.1.10]
MAAIYEPFRNFREAFRTPDVFGRIEGVEQHLVAGAGYFVGFTISPTRRYAFMVIS